MSKEQLSRWLRTIAWLKRNFKTAYPVKVSSVSIPKERVGDCLLHKKLFHIRIASDLQFESRMDALFHEWAHALTWDGFDSRMGAFHAVEWGAAHAKIYSLWEEWDYGRNINGSV